MLLTSPRVLVLVLIHWTSLSSVSFVLVGCDRVPVVVANLGLRLYTVGTWECSASWLYDMGLMVSYIITSFYSFWKSLALLNWTGYMIRGLWSVILSPVYSFWMSLALLNWTLGRGFYTVLIPDIKLGIDLHDVACTRFFIFQWKF